MRKLRFACENFADLKEKAYQTMIEWSTRGYNKEWLQQHMEQYRSSKRASLYLSAIELYGEYNSELVKKSEGMERMKKLEKDYEKIVSDPDIKDMMHRMFSFNEAMNKAFEALNIKYGEVNFECPLCRGKAYGARWHTPKNPAHATTIRGGCKGCGHSFMN